MVNGSKTEGTMDKLCLGVGRAIITPKVGCCLFGYRPDLISEKVEDDLTATAFYFSQGDRKALMVSVTLGLIANEISEEILDKIETKFSIPRQNCMISATHTHSGPDTAGMVGWGEMDRDYIDNILICGIINSVEEAIGSIQPVKIGYACGESFAAVNRRETRADNRTVLGQDPNGSFDPRMTVISFKNDEGEIVANLIHYAGHGTAAGANKEISRDWHGVMTDELESFSGAVTAFFNGASGDIGPRLSTGGTLSNGEIKYIYEIGRIGADDAIRIFKEIGEYSSREMICAGGEISVDLKERISLEKAKQIYKMYGENAVNMDSAIKNFAKQVILKYEKGEPELKAVSFFQMVIAFGDLVFVSFPYELFSSIAMRIDDNFPGKHVMSLSYTNGSMGYFATEEEKIRGGYEIEMFNYSEKTQSYCDNADSELVQKTTENVIEILNGGQNSCTE